MNTLQLPCQEHRQQLAHNSKAAAADTSTGSRTAGSNTATMTARQQLQMWAGAVRQSTCVRHLHSSGSTSIAADSEQQVALAACSTPCRDCLHSPRSHM
jgi:hypothetical protein